MSLRIVSDLQADLHAYSGSRIMTALTSRGFHAGLVYRVSNALWKVRVPLLPLLLTRIVHMLYAIDISYKAEIGPGLRIVHGMATVIGNGVMIGQNVKIYHDVTLGIADLGMQTGFPSIGDNVLLGAGARVLGAVKVGHDCAIGANAVVLKDVPDGHVAVGVPARFFPKSGKAEQE